MFLHGATKYANALYVRPITAGIAIGYGVIELGSWLYNGKSIEQNIFDK